MANEQYGISKEVQRLFQEKNKIRAQNRERFWYHFTNPHTPEIMYDSAVTRYHAMIAYREDLMRNSPKNALLFYLGIVLPVGLIAYVLRKQTLNRHRDFETGAIPYKDRIYKIFS